MASVLRQFKKSMNAPSYNTQFSKNSFVNLIMIKVKSSFTIILNSLTFYRLVHKAEMFIEGPRSRIYDWIMQIYHWTSFMKFKLLKIHSWAQVKNILFFPLILKLTTHQWALLFHIMLIHEVKSEYKGIELPKDTIH